jgi:hypothetical protein
MKQAEAILNLLTPVRFAHSRRKEKLRKKKESLLVKHKDLLCVFLLSWRLCVSP